MLDMEFLERWKLQSIEEMEAVTATNYLGTIYCTKAFLSSMLARKNGHIVNVASLAASFGIPGLAAYCGSKFAVLGFSESLSHELRGYWGWNHGCISSWREN